MPAVCHRGMVHLKGGTALGEGIVEACFRNQWRAACETFGTAAKPKWCVAGQLTYGGKSVVTD